MHPIERLRHVARADGAGPSLLVTEAAAALAGLADDGVALVTACRRLIDRHPAVGPMWWLAARVLSDPMDPTGQAWRAAAALEADTTVARLAAELPEAATVSVLGWPEQAAAVLRRRGDLEALVIDVDGEGPALVRRLRSGGAWAVDVPASGTGPAVLASSVLLVEASALGPRSLMALAGSRPAASVAKQAGVAVLAVAGEGRVLPSRLWDALVERVDERGEEPWDRLDELVPLDLLDAVAGPGGLSAPSDALGRADCPVVADLLRAPRGWP